jgi:hypothetical protein
VGYAGFDEVAECYETIIFREKESLIYRNSRTEGGAEYDKPAEVEDSILRAGFGILSENASHC